MSNWSQFKNPNTGLLFYKLVYKEPEITKLVHLKEDELAIVVPKNEYPFDPFYKDLCGQVARDTTSLEDFEGSEAFSLFTTYPGLFTGSGYQHDTKALGDYKIGFFFDHTIGQPVIPGSSVKGVLRSVFERDANPKGESITGNESVDTVRFLCDEIAEVLKKSGDPNKQLVWKNLRDGLDVEKLTALKVQIFGDAEGSSSMGSDTFFDAVIDLKKTSEKSLIYGDDFLTPHGDPFKNPVPLRFLKVLPGIAFKFRFNLTDFGAWTADNKNLLFKQILLTFGLGAKTSVGYGQLSADKPKSDTLADTSANERRPEETIGTGRFARRTDTIPEYDPLARLQNVRPAIPQASAEVAANTWPHVKDLKIKHDAIDAKVIAIEGNTIRVQPFISGLPEGYTLKINLNKFEDNPYKAGQMIKIQLTTKSGQYPNWLLQAKLLKS
jgi:CRISPR-associated protein Cmr6